MDSVRPSIASSPSVFRALFLVPFLHPPPPELRRRTTEGVIRERKRKKRSGWTDDDDCHAIVTHYLAVAAFSLFRLSNKGRRRTQRHAAAALSKAVRRKIEDRQKRDVPPPSLPL